MARNRLLGFAKKFSPPTCAPKQNHLFRTIRKPLRATFSFLTSASKTPQHSSTALLSSGGTRFRKSFRMRSYADTARKPCGINTCMKTIGEGWPRALATSFVSPARPLSTPLAVPEPGFHYTPETEDGLFWVEPGGKHLCPCGKHLRPLALRHEGCAQHQLVRKRECRTGSHVE